MSISDNMVKVYRGLYQHSACDPTVNQGAKIFTGMAFCPVKFLLTITENNNNHNSSFIFTADNQQLLHNKLPCRTAQIQLKMLTNEKNNNLLTITVTITK